MAKVVTLEELRKHTTKDSLYILLREKGKSDLPKKNIALTNLQQTVYDVTKFIDEVCLREWSWDGRSLRL